MKFKIKRKSIKVCHENNHHIGDIEWNNVWDKWILRIKHDSGLDIDDLKILRKFMKRLK